MEKLIKTIVILGIIIGLPLLADTISKFVTMGMFMKCMYFVSGLILIVFRKVGR